MKWFLFGALISSPLWAADVHPTTQERAACGPDVRRFCVLGSGIPACLQEHRAQLSKACQDVLRERGL